MDDTLSDQELDEIEIRASNASPAPWQSYIEGRDQLSGSSFIMVGEGEQREEDLYLSRDNAHMRKEDQDFIAHARQDIPRLIAEIRRLKSR